MLCLIHAGHSDPAKLKEKAEDVQRLSPDELKKRQLEIKVGFGEPVRCFFILYICSSALVSMLILVVYMYVFEHRN